MLLLTAQYSPHVKEVKSTVRFMDKLHTTLMVVDKTSDILCDAVSLPFVTQFLIKQMNLARALVLFCKGCGVLLGIPLFGLEQAFDRVNAKIKGDSTQTERDIARTLMHHEYRLQCFLDGEDFN